METIRNFLNKIRWDSKYQEYEYSVAYYDRLCFREIKLPFVDIRDINQTHFTTDKCVVCDSGEAIEFEMDTCIPFHRVRKIYKNNEIVYER